MLADLAEFTAFVSWQTATSVKLEIVMELLFLGSSDVSIIGGIEVPVLLQGDPAYPLKRWLIKPYPETANMLVENRDFN